MKQINKLCIVSVMIILSAFTAQKRSVAQVTYSDELDANRLVYWFYVSVREVEDPSTGYVSYELQRKSTKIDHGSMKVYDRELWEYLGDGSKMAIGPFNDFVEAEKAFYFYQITDKPKDLDTSFNETQQVFWFVLHVNRRLRSNSYELVRKPGAIASGTYRDFDTFLRENLMMRVMTVGPFQYMPEAAKEIYRLH
jgi:hypothetical protein